MNRFHIFFRKGESMRVIAIVNQKGGVGKTTTVYNLATALVLHGKKVLMIDLDPQASLTLACGYDPDIDDFKNNHISDVLLGHTNSTDACFTIDSVAGKADNLFLIPSSFNLAKIEMELGNVSREGSQKRLRDALIPFETVFDYVIIDCPPQFGLLTINALIAATDCVIPTRVDYLSYKGLQNVLRTITDIQSDSCLNPNLVINGVVITFFRRNVKNEREMLDLISKSVNILGVIKESADVGRYAPWGIPVVLSLPKSDTAQSYFEITNKLDSYTIHS